jgi:hypothetical protein
MPVLQTFSAPSGFFVLIAQTQMRMRSWNLPEMIPESKDLQQR